MEKMAKFIIIISHIPVFITTAYALFLYKQLGHELKVFSYFLFLSGAIQITSLLFWFFGENNLPLLHIYVAGGFLCLAWFYKTVLNDFINSKIIWGTTIAFLCFSILNSIFIQDIFTFNSHALTVESILIIILSLSTFILFLKDIVRETRVDSLQSLNWINSGLFIYYSSSLIIFYFGEIITHSFSKDLNRYTWVLHSFFSMMMYSFFFVGLWKRPKN